MQKQEIILQFGQYVLKKIREKGVFYCGKKALYKIITPIIGLFSYPFCLVMNIKFLPVHISRIGHLCIEPDCYIKEGILGLRPKYNSIILAPHKKVANAHLLNYWKHYIRIISSPLPCFLLDPLVKNRFTQFNVGRYASVINTKADFPKIQNKWIGRPPLLSLTELDYKRGWACLRKLGIPEDAWFVCVHCREEGYAPGENQTYRNANINNYLLAMKAIVNRGGWVIQMGDPSMKPLPQMDHIIDYAHLDIKSDWMDVFLCASCKFFLGSESGLSGLAFVFGVPGGIANHAPMSTVLWCGPFDVGIPKLIWSLKEERYLSFKEVLSSPISNFRFDPLYSKAGVCVVDNSPEDIKELAMEMLDRVDGKALYFDEDERLQERFKSLMNPSHYSYGSASRVGRDFLRKYAVLLDY